MVVFVAVDVAMWVVIVGCSGFERRDTQRERERKR